MRRTWKESVMFNVDRNKLIHLLEMMSRYRDCSFMLSERCVRIRNNHLHIDVGMKSDIRELRRICRSLGNRILRLFFRNHNKGFKRGYRNKELWVAIIDKDYFFQLKMSFEKLKRYRNSPIRDKLIGSIARGLAIDS